MSQRYFVPVSRSADGQGLWLEPYARDAPQQWQAHWPLIGEIHGIGSGRCMDVPNSSITPGTQVQIYDCHGNAPQQWTYDPTSKELIYAYAMAMGAPQPMCLQPRWGGTISNDKSELVMDVKGGATNNNTLVQLYTPNGTEAQQWSRTSSQGGALYAVGAGKCLDLPSSTWANDTQAVISTCASPLSAAQTWTYHPIAQTFIVNSLSRPKCLDAAGGGTTAGTAVVINDCTPDAASQRWSRDFGSSTVINVNSVRYGADGTVLSSLVLDVTGAGTADGTSVQLTPLKLDDQGMPTPTSSQEWVWSMN